MASAQLELRVAPVLGRDYAGVAAAAQVVDVLENDLEPHSARFVFNASFRGCCYNPLTKILLVCDPVACCVRTFDVEIRSDTELRVAPRGEIGERGTAAGKFQCPVAVDANTRGEIAVADFKLNRVAFFTGSGNALHYFGKTGASRGEFRGILDLKFTALGHVAIVDSENHRVQVMTTTGGLVMVLGRQGVARGAFQSPCAVDIARNGDVFVCDAGNKRVQRFSAKGKWLAAWGSHRCRGITAASTLPPATPQYDANGVSITQSPLRSLFDTPCDVLLGGSGEVFVCDAGRREIFVFSDTGSCLHVVATPKKATQCPIAMCCVRNSLLAVTRHSSAPATTSLTPLLDQASDHRLVVIPPPERVPAGKLSAWPWQTLLETISYLTYADAIHVRLVSRACHRGCRELRDAWRLFPLTPGTAGVTKYNKVQRRATGRVAVVEAFGKWGLRVFKPANRLRRHVMDFDAGFRSAVSSLFGPMFFFLHEQILRAIFCFYSRASRDKAEIDEAAFVEMVTQIHEVQAGFLAWHQSPALRGCKQIPAIRTAATQSLEPLSMGGDDERSAAAPETSLVPQLKLVETAQQQQLHRLLTKLQAL